MSSFFRGKRKAEVIFNQPTREQRSAIIEQTAQLNELEVMLKERELTAATARMLGEEKKAWASRTLEFYKMKNAYLDRGEEPPWLFLEEAGAHMRKGFKFISPTADGKRITGGELVPIDDQGNLMINLEFIDESGKRQVAPMTGNRKSFEGGDEPVITNMPEIIDAAARSAAEDISISEEVEKRKISLHAMYQIISAGLPENQAEDQQWRFDLEKLRHDQEMGKLSAEHKARLEYLEARSKYEEISRKQRAEDALELERERGKRQAGKDKSKADRQSEAIGARKEGREDEQAHEKEMSGIDAAHKQALEEAKAKLKERVHVAKRKADFAYDNLMYQDGNYPTEKANEELASPEFMANTMDDISFVVGGIDGFEPERNGRPSDSTKMLHRHLKTMANQLSISKRMDPYKAWDLVMEQVLAQDFDEIINKFRGSPGWFHLPPGMRFPTGEEDKPKRLTDVPGAEPEPVTGGKGRVGAKPSQAALNRLFKSVETNPDPYWEIYFFAQKEGYLPDDIKEKYPKESNRVMGVLGIEP